MLTFKLFIRIIGQHKKNVGAYFAIMVAALLFIVFNEPTDDWNYWVEPVFTVAVADHDQSVLSQRLKAHLSAHHEVGEASDIGNWVEDVFSRDFSHILNIPKGFEEAVLSGAGAGQLEVLFNSSRLANAALNEQVEAYFRILSAYLASGFSLEEGLRQTEIALSQAVEINFVNTAQSAPRAYFYFRFMPFALVLLITLILGLAFLTLNDVKLNQRIECGALTLKRRNLEKILSCLVLGIGSWLFFMVVPFALFPQEMLGIGGAMRLLNSFVLVFFGIAAAFLFSQFVKNYQQLSELSTSLLIILAYFGGVMMDLWNMGDTVRAISRFTPFYWYTILNDKLFFYQTYDWELLGQSIAIQFAFAAAILAAGLVISKEKSKR